MSIRLYNTLTREVEEFSPLKPGEVSFYACGPTVYNYPHIGNLRTFLFEDLLRRWLEYRGYRVKMIMNLTDVDDKTIRNSIAQNMTLKDYTDIYKKAFFEDLQMLHVRPAQEYPAATGHIPEMESLISRLVDKGYAYETEDGVYFRVSSLEGYGKLAKLDKENLKAGASERVAADEYERDSITDFALWKKWTPEDGDVKWQTRFGEGRPGWHIECSVMSMKYLGETIDIHAGGVDLIFPHHENEIAQSEAATGKQFVRYWLHVTHLVVDGEKMSKSKGNFYTLRDLTDKGYSPRSIRYLLFTTHYRKPLNFTFDGIKAADSSLKRIDDFIFMLKNVRRENPAHPELSSLVLGQKRKFMEALDNDLNISEAMGALFELIKIFNERAEELSRENADEVLEFLREIDTVLAFIDADTADELQEEERKLLDERVEARKRKDFAASDRIRDELLARGIEVRDTAEGQAWKRAGK